MTNLVTDEQRLGQNTDRSKVRFLCFRCADRNNLIELNSTAWFDQYMRGGNYVHFNCLSPTRVKELIDTEIYELAKFFNNHKLEEKENALILSNAG